MAIKRPILIPVFSKIIGKSFPYFIHNRLLSIYRNETMHNIFKSKKRNNTKIKLIDNSVLDSLKKFGLAKSEISDSVVLNSISQAFITFENNLQTYETKANKLYEYKYSNSPNLKNLNEFLYKFGLTNFKALADEYLGCNSVLHHYDLWKTIPWNNEKIQSQNWHRDPEDRKILKIFIYLNDVTESNGCFKFIRETQNSGKLGKIFPQPFPKGIYIPESVINDTFDSKLFINAEGKQGTVMFADTTGFHCGGFVKNGERKLIHYIFTSNLCPYMPVVPKL